MKSLKNLRILNTRPQVQAIALSEQIRQADGIAIECPTLEITGLKNIWLQALPSLDKVNKAIFISANAVYFCFTQLKSHNITWPKHIEVIAIGNATAKALAEFNIRVDKIPLLSDSEHLISIDTLHQIQNQTILLFKGMGGRMLIEEQLISRGANLVAIDVYKRSLPKISQQFIDSLWQDDLVDIILITSEQSLINLFKLFDKKAHNWLQNKPYVIISRRLVELAKFAGIKNILLSAPENLMDTLYDYYQGLVHGQ